MNLEFDYVDQVMSNLFEAIGLSGFALSFAFRDALSNLLAGVLIIFYQPFKPGDTITVSGKTGVVEAINFRYAVLTSDGKTVLVPNSSIFGTIIEVQHGGGE